MLLTGHNMMRHNGVPGAIAFLPDNDGEMLYLQVDDGRYDEHPAFGSECHLEVEAELLRQLLHL